MFLFELEVFEDLRVLLLEHLVRGPRVLFHVLEPLTPQVLVYVLVHLDLVSAFPELVAHVPPDLPLFGHEVEPTEQQVLVVDGLEVHHRAEQVGVGRVLRHLQRLAQDRRGQLQEGRRVGIVQGRRGRGR